MTRNVAVLILDAVRKDVFDEVAQRLQSKSDIEYHNCKAASSWSVPSHASLFTGQIPSKHGVHQFSPGYESVHDETFLSERLHNHHSVSITANQWTDTEFGWDSYFDTHEFIHRDKLFPEGCELNSSSQFYLDYLKRCFWSNHTTKSLLNGIGDQILDALNQRSYPRLVDDGGKLIIKT